VKRVDESSRRRTSLSCRLTLAGLAAPVLLLTCLALGRRCLRPDLPSLLRSCSARVLSLEDCAQLQRSLRESLRDFPDDHYLVPAQVVDVPSERMFLIVCLDRATEWRVPPVEDEDLACDTPSVYYSGIRVFAADHSGRPLWSAWLRSHYPEPEYLSPAPLSFPWVGIATPGGVLLHAVQLSSHELLPTTHLSHPGPCGDLRPRWYRSHCDVVRDYYASPTIFEAPPGPCGRDEVTMNDGFRRPFEGGYFGRVPHLHGYAVSRSEIRLASCEPYTFSSRITSCPTGREGLRAEHIREKHPRAWERSAAYETAALALGYRIPRWRDFRPPPPASGTPSASRRTRITSTLTGRSAVELDNMGPRTWNVCVSRALRHAGCSFDRWVTSSLKECERIAEKAEAERWRARNSR
jgi:hypothetical protein